jgi:DNA-binding ferritin-like protein
MNLQKAQASNYILNMIDDLTERSQKSRYKRLDIFHKYLENYKIEKQKEYYAAFMNTLGNNLSSDKYVYAMYDTMNNATNEPLFCEAVIEYYLAVYMGSTNKF